jgi:DNA-binding transcriptional regulator YhcF (GntR family)
MLITARQLALKIGVTPNTVSTKLRRAGLKVTKKNNTRLALENRDTQFYYNLNEALNALQPKD